MKLDFQIWSDVVCPFCYIGKRHLEQALSQFPEVEAEITWKSFQLDPSTPENPEMDLYDSLASKYGKDRSWAIEMTKGVTNSAKQVGLDFDMDSAVPSNTLKAHQLLHLAKKKGVQDPLKEKFLSAYFVEGKAVNDNAALIEISKSVGLDSLEIEKTLQSDDFKDEVEQDISMAQQIGVQGVPFFLIQGKYGLSGAQPVEVFVDVIQQVIDKEKESV